MGWSNSFVIGALIIGTTNKGLNMLGVDPYWQQIVKGLIIVVAVLIDTLKRRKKRKLIRKSL